MFRQHSVFFFLALVFVILWTTKYGFFHSFINQHVTHFKSRFYMISSLSTFRLVLNFIISSFICLHYATLPEGMKNTKPLQLIMMHWGVFKLVRDRIEHTLLRFMIHEWARHSLKLCANPIGDHSYITSSHFWDFWTPLRQHVFSTKNKQKLAFSDPPPPPYKC